MKISYRLLGLTALLAVTIPAISYAAEQNQNKNFKDVLTGHPFESSIALMKTRGVVKGYSDGTFAPDNSISRGEFLAMIMRSVASGSAGEKCFKDVNKEWFASSVCAAKKKGIISGYGDGTFKPEKNINFAEAASVIAKAYNLNPSAAASREPWYKPSVSKLARKKAIPATIDYPEKKLSRAETVEILYRLNEKDTKKASKTYATLTSPLPTLASCAELEDKVKVSQYKQSGIYRGESGVFGGMKLMAVPMMETTSAEGETADAAPSESNGAGTEYSSTNVQVEGVDEADVIKNDGEFIYLISGRTVRIVRAYPPENMGQVAKLELPDKNFTPADMYVAGDKLVVIGSTYKEIQPSSKMMAPSIWRGFGGNRSVLYVMDMSDKSNLREERSVEFDGSTVSSRRVGNEVYLVVNDMPNYYGILEQKKPIADALPQYNDSLIGEERPIARCSQIHFVPHYDQMNMLTVASINITDPSAAIKKEVIMGSGETVYASPESLYVASQYTVYPEIGIFNTWGPMPVNYEQKTTFFRFALNNGDVKFATKGDVPGTLLNQFSMDESDDAFRVATTTGEVWNTAEGKAKNHLYILDRNNLGATLGKIENIAPGEKIYSVRFLGKRAYMVTFKKVDPFFVIDVENPAAPKILGELKIPGYSDYLHPYDENHIIGFGKEAVDPQSVADEWPGRDFDFAWYQGMKIALFDATDVANPKMMFKEMIGDRGTDSEVLRNHKALLYDKARGLFALPVMVAEVKDKTSPDQYTGSQYGQTVFQGAYVYTLDLEKGFQLKGKITNHEDDDGAFHADANYSWYQEGKNTIKRIISIDGYLYTVSLGKIKATDRDTMEEKNVTKLEADERQGFLFSD